MIHRFILSHLKHNTIRSIILITSIFLSSFLSFLLAFIYLHIVHSVEYYSVGNIDPKRFEISRASSILTLLNQGQESGIDQITLETIAKDQRITKWYAFSLIDIPAIIRVSEFGYALETDIPFFTVTDTLLCPSGPCAVPTPIGFSRLLLDFYNLNIAGSAEFFPKIPESLIHNRGVTLTIGTSKVFDYDMKNPYIFSGKVTMITSDFPSVGITIPESVGKIALSSIGKTLARPYRVVGYVGSLGDEEYIRKQYGSDAGYQVRFDTDKQAHVRDKLSFIRFLFTTFTFINLGILAFIIGLFIFDILRQYSSLFRTFRMIGIPIHTNFIIVIGEICLAGCFGLLLSVVGFLVCIHYSKLFLIMKLTELGISLPLLPLNGILIVSVSILYVLFLIILTLIFSAPGILRKWENGESYR